MICLARKTRRMPSVIAIACVLAAAPGCGFAVKHPAVTAGVVAGALGFTTCKLASDNYAACGLVAGGAGAFLGLVAATALWLGGDGNSAAIEEQAQPEDDRPPMPLMPLPEPDAKSKPAANPAPTNPPSASPAPTNPPSTSPAPTSPPTASPAPTNPPS